MYNRLDSLYPNQPNYSDPEVAWRYLAYEYFLDEIDEVRERLGLDNFCLIGQGWGGLLVQEYAVKHGKHPKGAIISSIVSEIDGYVNSVNRRRQEVLPQIEIDFIHECGKNNDYDNQHYQEDMQILNINFVDRRQPSKLYHLRDLGGSAVCNIFQGNNELVITGKLRDWHFRDQLKNTRVPTSVTFGKNETMPISTTKTIQKEIPNSHLATTPNGGRHHMVDSPSVYYRHLVDFIREAGNDNFRGE